MLNASCVSSVYILSILRIFGVIITNLSSLLLLLLLLLPLWAIMDK